MPRSVGTVGRGLVVEVDWVVRHDFFNGGSEGEFKRWGSASFKV